MLCLKCRKKQRVMWAEYCKPCAIGAINTDAWMKKFMKRRRMLATRAKNKALKEMTNE